MKQTALEAIVVTLFALASAEPENQPAARNKQHNDQQDFTLYAPVTNQATANDTLAVLNTWKEEYRGGDAQDLLGRIDHFRILAQSVVRGQTSLPAQPAPVTRQTQPESIEIPTSTQVMATRIGQHHLGETLQEWYRHEPDANRQTENIGDIGSHRVGENFAQWLQFNSLDLDDICHKHGDKSIDFKGVCRRLSAIRDSGSGEFYTTDQTGRTFGWRFNGGSVTDYSINGTWHNAVIAPEPSDPNIKVTKANNREYTWKFVDGKLSEVGVTPNWSAIYAKYSEEGVARHLEIVPSFQEEVDFLTQTYGKPSKVVTAPYGNAYGALGRDQRFRGPHLTAHGSSRLSALDLTSKGNFYWYLFAPKSRWNEHSKRSRIRTNSETQRRVV